MSAALLLLAAGCARPAGETAAPGVGETAEPPMEPAFTFAVVGDAHVTGEGPYLDRLEAALRRAEEEGAVLAVLVGDIAWGGGLEVVPGALLSAGIPVLPVIGDNVVVSEGTAANWEAAMAPVREALAAEVEDWRDGVRAVELGGGVEARLQNVAFTLRGVRFVALDWVARGTTGAWAEMADLHDVEGGTLPFLADELEAAAAEDGPAERVLLFAHHPMHLSPGAIDKDEIDRLWAVTAAAADLVAEAHGGHYHLDVDEEDAGGGYDVHVTTAVFNEEAPFRLVRVSTNGLRFAYEQEFLAAAGEEGGG